MTDIDNPESLSQVPIAFGAVETHTINAQTVLLLNRHSGAQSIVSAEVVQALGRCREFRTSRQHARVIAGPDAPEEALTDIARTFESLAAQGVLLRADGILADMVLAEPVSPIATRVFIITADRPSAVERLLDSMLRAGGLTSFDAVFLIDDSRLPENRAANAELLSSFNTRSAKELYYFGEEQQQAFAASLKSTLGGGDSAAAVDFAIAQAQSTDAATYGRARNLCLLLSVGCKALMLDDDILCQGFDFPDIVQTPRIDSAAASSAYFAPSYEVATSRAPQRPESILSTVSRFVGVPAGTALKELSRPLPSVESLLGCEGDVAAALAKHTQVLITQVGSVGDPGTEGAGWLTSLDRGGQASFVEAQAVAAGAELTRCCWRGVPAATFASIGSMSQLTALDNSVLLPPYFPMHRGEDLLFAGLTKLLHPSSVALELPVCVPHLPIDSRPPISLDAEEAETLNLGLAFRFVMRQLEWVRSDTPGETLAKCADSLAEQAAQGDKDLKVLLSSLMTDARIEQMHRVVEALSYENEPQGGPWTAFLRARHQRLQMALQQPLVLPAEAEDATAPPIPTLAALRESALQFASLLRHWSHIRQAAVQAYHDALYTP